MSVGKVIALSLLLLQIGHGFGQDFSASGGQAIGAITDLFKSFSSNTSQIQNVMNLMNDPNALMANIGNIVSTGKMPNMGNMNVTAIMGTIRNLGGDCMNHMMLMVQALSRQETWALRMIDAIGKPPAGLMNLKLLWIGDWDECLGTKAVVNKTVSGVTMATSPFSGKYCPLSFKSQTPGPYGQKMALTIGTCFPDSCSSSDATAIFKLLFSFLPKNLTSSIPEPEVTCKENSLPLDGRAIAIVVVCAIFVAVMTFATIYDVMYVNWMVKQPKKGVVGAIELETGLKSPDVYVVQTNEKGSYENGIQAHSEKGSYENGLHANNAAKVTSNDSNQPPKYTPGLIERILLSFSVFTNGTKLLSTHQGKGALTAVNGLRFISMSWVIVGHGYGQVLSPPTDNGMQYMAEIIKRKEFTPVVNGTFSVDTFFVLSGLLVSYLSLKEMKKVKGVRGFKWFMFYFHRFWRLTPPYMLLLMVLVSLDKYMGNGPLWRQDGSNAKYCETAWWTNLLYINNLVKGDQMMGCFGWTWYLANDMQFYILSPLLMIPLFYSPIIGGIICLLTVGGSAVVSGLISMHYELPSSVLLAGNNGHYMWDYYVKPWCRVGPYVVGIFTGYMLYRTELKMKINRYVNVIVWLVAMVSGCLIIYGLYTDDFKDPLTLKQDAVYNATARTAWGLCVAWVIFSCANGYGGPINHILSWGAFVPLGRLTYFAYLVHLPLMDIYNTSGLSSFTAYDYGAIYQLLGHICMAYASAFVLSLSFEAPMMGLEKVLLGRGKSS